MKIRKLIGLVTLVSSVLLSLNMGGISSAEENNEYSWKTLTGSIWDIAEITQKNNLNETPYPLQMFESQEKLKLHPF